MRSIHLSTLGLFFASGSIFSAAQAVTGSVSGSVQDPLGAAVPGATVELLSGQLVLATTRSDASGRYSLSVPRSGSYRLRSSAPSFRQSETLARTLTPESSLSLNLTLATPTDTEEITVTATGTPTPLAQVAGAVTVLGEDQYPYVRDIQEPLRFVPGVQVTQSGEQGGTTSLFIRGGDSDANEVLVDGVAVDDLGGAVEFANIAAAGLARLEVLREPDSALYGSEALAGVVSLTTRRGTTPLPLLEYEGDGGNFGTYRNEGSLSGALHRFDYFSDFARQDTGNSIAHSSFHNATFAENIGFEPNSTTDLRFNLRHQSTGGGRPNATALYGISDDSFATEHDLVIGGVLNSQTTERWHNQLRYGGLRLNFHFDNYAPAGIPVYDSQGNLLDYAGAPVTIRGANGYTVSGQATLSYPGTYPSTSDNKSQRDFMYAQTDYLVGSVPAALGGRSAHVHLLAGFHYEDERGTSLYTGGTVATADRGNYSTMLEIQGDAGGRFFYTVGSGLEDNAVYGFAATPRLSGAYYLLKPSSAGFWNGTKLHSSFSKGIKGPSISVQNNSLYALLVSAGSQNLIGQYGITQPGAENSRSYDGGVEQELGNGRARVDLTYFHNEYTNGLEYLSQDAIATNFGIDTSTVPYFYGAYVNSLAYRAQGLETEVELRVAQHLFVRGGYTLLDAKVQRSFASSALAPTYNPLFPAIAIGAYGPLVGNRPFRRARNSGYFGLQYTRSRWNAQLNGTLVGLRDDSDFLDGSLLLPNHNLDGAYQRLELTGSYRLSQRVSAYTEIQNLLSEHYQEAFGYPALPFNFRSGVKLSLGGESWTMR